MTPKRTAKLTSVLRHRQSTLTVVMENVYDPHNISAVMRTCDAVGIQDIYILNTKIPRHKKFGSKSSSSAAKWMTIHQFTNAEECFAALRKNYSHIYATHLASDLRDYFAAGCVCRRLAAVCRSRRSTIR